MSSTNTSAPEHVCIETRRMTGCNPTAEVDTFECKVCGDCWEEDCSHTYIGDPSFHGGVARRNSVRLIHGDTLKTLRTLRTKSVHCVITSPPYWGVRKYGLGEAEIGAEPSFEKFLSNLVEIFREVRRVLHDSGNLWVNMGDSYNSKHTQGYYGDQGAHGRLPHGHEKLTIPGMHSKNLIGQPWRLALALQKDGWILRDDIVWCKSNAGPFSGTDRTTKCHEYLFLLGKKDKYFWDWKAIEEESANKALLTPEEVAFVLGKLPNVGGDDNVDVVKLRRKVREMGQGDDGYRRKRSVWVIPTESFPKAHYSTFPQRLVEPCILAGTSEMGCCPECLAPIRRLLEQDKDSEQDHGAERKRADAPGAELSPTSVYRTGKTSPWKTVGWVKTCNHAFDRAIPCTVLDPFMGSGTTAVVAERLGRDCIGIELSDESMDIAQERIALASERPLYTDFVVESGPKPGTATKCARCYGRGHYPSETCNTCADCNDPCEDCKGTGEIRLSHEGQLEESPEQRTPDPLKERDYYPGPMGLECGTCRCDEYGCPGC